MPPTLPLTEPSLDPHGQQRGDAGWLRDQWDRPGTRVAVFAGERLLVGARPDSADARVRWLSPTDFPAGDAGDTDSTGDSRSVPYPGDWVFLGIAADGVAYFAVAATGEPLPDDQLMPVRQLGLAGPATSDLRIVVGGLALLNWHRRHRRCPMCGEPTVIGQGGWVRRCPADDSQHFPRVDPAVIMLVIDESDRALLGRQSRWSPRWFSTLAGFVEPGETLENAVAREVLEEAGIPVSDVQYRGSQPWPFPSSLMLGFHARAVGTDVVADADEIAEARWFTRDELAAACATGEVRLPPRFSISRWLIELWFGSELPGDWSRE